MRNVFAALVGLVMVCVCLPAQEAEVAVYLKAGAEQPAAIVESLQRETQALLRPAGVKLVWRELHESSRHEDFQAVVVARFEGSCVAAREEVEMAGAGRPAALASTPVQEGVILPFTTVNCGAVKRLTSALMRDEPGARRNYLFGRALGRVLAHELYHILGQTRLHADKGIAKPAFHARELLAETFAFHEPAILVMRASAGESVAAPPEVAGR
ncbi:MAG: hypothetical protein J0L64_09900 [Acidobacteria bacterium]|nr:hypothetical protein [Acidobacteriota bacterium]